jgi:hypothetical protein
LIPAECPVSCLCPAARRAQSEQYLALAEAAGQLQSVECGQEVFLLFNYYSVAGGAVTELQKLRLMAGCRPNLSPDVPTIVREALRMHGLLPEQQQEQRNAAPAAAEAAAAAAAAVAPAAPGGTASAAAAGVTAAAASSSGGGNVPVQ